MKRVAALAAIAAVVLAACGGGGGKKTAANKTTTSVSDTSTTVEGSTTTTGAAGATATTKKAATATTSAAKVNGQSASNYTPPAGATPAKPSPSGTYTYDNQATGTNTFGAPPAKSSLIVDPPQGTKQHSTNDMGSSGKTETTLDFRPEGVHLVEVKVTAQGQSYDFTANPAPLAAPTGVQPGQSVTFDVSDAARNTSIHVQIDFVRMETITIGGQPVNTMVIHQVGTLSGGLTGTQTMDAWVSPQYDLFVKTHSTGDVHSGVFEAKSDVTSTLEKPTPN
ncbi:MAG: hypothetical protein JOZ68_09365 [Acidimicrobiia bacterium]|nr:hypothetical protein [Acidimicrobiia bacterium]MBV8982817.1 hypothetical protein [Acidimicrobiia bacterium]MBV9041203.1 hypothetical protein [Acidimicrobiia bacterium]